LADALADAGVTAADVAALAAVARSTGYLNTSSQQDIESLAVLWVGLCRDVAAGERTWDELAALDVSIGTSEGDASAMTQYVASRLCPKVR